MTVCLWVDYNYSHPIQRSVFVVVIGVEFCVDSVASNIVCVYIYIQEKLVYIKIYSQQIINALLL